MEPAEDAVRVLRHVHRLCRPGGVVLDLTSVPPAALVEHAGVAVGHLDQELFLLRAARTEAAVDQLVQEGLLVEEASLALDVLKHFDSGADLLDDVSGRGATHVPPALRPILEPLAAPLAERSYCLLRRLRVVAG